MRASSQAIAGSNLKICEPSEGRSMMHRRSLRLICEVELQNGCSTTWYLLTNKESVNHAANSDRVTVIRNTVQPVKKVQRKQKSDTLHMLHVRRYRIFIESVCFTSSNVIPETDDRISENSFTIDSRIPTKRYFKVTEHASNSAPGIARHKHYWYTRGRFSSGHKFEK